MKPENRRLNSEHEDMLELFAASSLMKFRASGYPPTVYDVEMSCTGLVRLGDQIVYSNEHRFRMTIGPQFPLVPPDIVWQTPVFHPNIRPPRVCTGDIWYPAMSLAELCVELCELVQYKSFNVYDPLDLEASEWLSRRLADEDEKHIVPIDPRPVRDPVFEIELQAHVAGGDGGE